MTSNFSPINSARSVSCIFYCWLPSVSWSQVFLKKNLFQFDFFICWELIKTYIFSIGAFLIGWFYYTGKQGIKHLSLYFPIYYVYHFFKHCQYIFSLLIFAIALFVYHSNNLASYEGKRPTTEVVYTLRFCFKSK